MPAELSLIVVEDNELLREEMVSFLTRPGWQAHGVDCGEELSAWLMQHTPHIAVLDVNLPYEDGYSIAVRLRSSYPSIGIIMLTARVRRGERATGYQSGADVYLTKPTSTAELISVIENLSRRIPAMAIPTDYFVLSHGNGQLQSSAGVSCLLTPTEARLLKVLALTPQREVESEYLAHTMSLEGKLISKESLPALISRFRSKSKQVFGLDSFVTASRGVGYRLTVLLQVRD